MPASQVLARWAAHVVGEDAPASGPEQLCVLVEKLTGIRAEHPASAPGEQVVLAAFAAMEDAGLSAAALTCSPHEVASGDAEALATLHWELAQSFFLAHQFPGEAGQWKGAMLTWCQAACAPRGVTVTDFHRSWQSGMGFCALLDAFVHDTGVVGLSARDPDMATANLQHAFSIAHRIFGVLPIMDSTDLTGVQPPDERSVLLYLALLHSGVRRGEKPGGTGWAVLPAAVHQQPLSRANLDIASGIPPALSDENDPSAAARQSLMRALAGRPEGSGVGGAVGSSTSDEIAKVAALIEELRDPINNVAEVLQRPQGDDAMSEAEAKATFRQLTERMRRLVEVLPDTLECTQEAQALEESIQAELRKVRARAEFEEAYIARLAERQRQVRVMSQVLQQSTKEQMEVLRGRLIALLRVVDERQSLLIREVVDVENDKVSILQHSLHVAEADLERMRTAEQRADAILRAKIASATWLETGHCVEDLLVGCEAGRIEGKSDFGESFVDFNCTLDLRAEHNVAAALDHALHDTSFEERKVLERSRAEEALRAPSDQPQRPLSGPAALGGSSRQSVRAVLQKSQEGVIGRDQEGAKTRSTWSMTVDGDWVKIDEVDRSEGPGGGGDEIERVLAYARTLPPKEADEFLSQDFVRSIVKGADDKRQSDRVLEAALRESVGLGRAPPTGGLSGDYSGFEMQESPRGEQGEGGERIVASLEARVCDGNTIVCVGGWDGTHNLHSMERLAGGRGGGARWALMGSLSSSRRGLAAAQVGNKIYVIGGWDGASYLSTVEVYDVALGTWSSAKSMPQPRCFAAAVSMNGLIYVAGGYFGSYNLDTAEVYDPEKDEWKALPRMSCSRRGLALGAIAGTIYAVGGWDGKHNLSSVEAFTPQIGGGGGWRKAEPLSIPRCSAAAAVLEGRMYVCGGWDGKSFLDSVECFQPTGEGWKEAPSMLTARSYGAVVAAGGRLVACGGWDGVSSRRLDTVEELVPGLEGAGRGWVQRNPLTTPRYGLAAVVV